MFTFLKWNGKYGTPAKFVVKDNDTNKQSLFSPSNAKDLAWTDKNISTDEEFKQWQDFGNETVDNLDEVVF